MNRGAVLSTDGLYRYRLWRIWDAALPVLLFVMLNPSTADAEQDDPTIDSCIRIAKAQGYGGIEVVNLYGWRATEPDELLASALVDPIGPANDQHICTQALLADRAVVAWGRHGASKIVFNYLGKLQNRYVTVLDILAGQGAELVCLRHNKDGSPGHPLYMPASTPLIPFVG